MAGGWRGGRLVRCGACGKKGAYRSGRHPEIRTVRCRSCGRERSMWWTDWTTLEIAAEALEQEPAPAIKVVI